MRGFVANPPPPPPPNPRSGRVNHCLEKKKLVCLLCLLEQGIVQGGGDSRGRHSRGGAWHFQPLKQSRTKRRHCESDETIFEQYAFIF